MTVEPLSLRERKKQAVRSRILQVAKKLFRSNGYERTSMDEIAESAEIARKTLFNYMSSKEAILMALVDDLVYQNMPEWEEKPEPIYYDVRDVIAPNLDKRLKTIAKNRWLLTMAAEYTNYYNAIKSEYVSSAMRANSAARVQRITILQEERKVRGDLSAEEVSQYYDALRDATIQRWLLTPGSVTADLSTSFENAMKVLLQGLLPPSE